MAVAKWELLDTTYDPTTLLDSREMGEMRWQENYGGMERE